MLFDMIYSIILWFRRVFTLVDKELLDYYTNSVIPELKLELKKLKTCIRPDCQRPRYTSYCGYTCYPDDTYGCIAYQKSVSHSMYEPQWSCSCTVEDRLCQTQYWNSYNVMYKYREDYVKVMGELLKYFHTKFNNHIGNYFKTNRVMDAISLMKSLESENSMVKFPSGTKFTDQLRRFVNGYLKFLVYDKNGRIKDGGKVNIALLCEFPQHWGIYIPDSIRHKIMDRGQLI